MGRMKRAIGRHSPPPLLSPCLCVAQWKRKRFVVAQGYWTTTSVSVISFCFFSLSLLFVWYSHELGNVIAVWAFSSWFCLFIVCRLQDVSTVCLMLHLLHSSSHQCGVIWLNYSAQSALQMVMAVNKHWIFIEEDVYELKVFNILAKCIFYCGCGDTDKIHIYDNNMLRRPDFIFCWITINGSARSERGKQKSNQKRIVSIVLQTLK